MADPIVLSKFADPADFDHLVEEAVIVERYFTTAREQHNFRRWEYALALRAYDVWAQQDYEVRGHANRMHGGTSYDVGGAGSPFSLMISEVTGGHARVVDPDDPASGLTLEQYLRCRSSLAHHVFCLSVLEHVDDLDQFCYHLSCLTAPGGLLFLTMDAVDRAPGGDTFHFHWMRKRIFDRTAWLGLIHTFLTQYAFELLGDFDERYPGAQVHDYSFASVALVKRR